MPRPFPSLHFRKGPGNELEQPQQQHRHHHNNAIDIYIICSFRISTFYKRADASYICLMLTTRGLDESFKGPGYHLPHVKVELPTGIHSYPAIFSYPNVSTNLPVPEKEREKAREKEREHCSGIVKAIELDRQ